MRRIIIIIFLLCTLVFLYGRYIEVNNFTTKEYTINSTEIPDSFTDLKIVQFSDILYDKDFHFWDKLVDEINKNTPDIIIFTGDLFKKGVTYDDNDYDTIKKYLSKMEANLSKFAVIGDNDQEYIEKYTDILYETDFELLDNENKLFFYKDNTPINIIGITDFNNIPDFNSLLSSDVEFNYNLVITHTPDTVLQLAPYNIDCVLTGHSLGGIINLPFYGGIIKKNGAKTYINDYYKIQNTDLYISNGLGYEDFNFRLFNTPSINIYRFSK